MQKSESTEEQPLARCHLCDAAAPGDARLSLLYLLGWRIHQQESPAGFLQLHWCCPDHSSLAGSAWHHIAL